MRTPWLVFLSFSFLAAADPAFAQATNPYDVRRFGAQPDKMIVDRQTASPSSWKTPCIATRMAW
jgi:hypothetical protein